jgi:predicted unusual protein kinase regulating ubiquinone biosynthesis (AarF/ABC1/UbiB family)
MDPRRAEQIRTEIAKRLATVAEPPPSSAIGRAARTAMTIGRGGTLMMTRALFGALGRTAHDLEGTAAVIAAIGDLKGVTMKVGQILSYIDVGLPEELPIALSVLQAHAQPMPFRRVEEIVRADLRSHAHELLERMETAPIAAASIGQVHRAVLPDGTRVAVKVRYPGIQEAIARDFGPATLGGTIAAKLYPRARLDALIADVRARILEETDYRLEATRQERFRGIFAGHHLIDVPAVHSSHSTARVLTTTLADGLPLEQYLSTAPSERQIDQAGEALFDFYLGTLFKRGVYNSDPHPGNYLFARGGRVSFVDFGSAREFEPGFVDRIAALTHAVSADDPILIERALAELGIARDYDRDSMRWLLGAFFGPILKDEVAPFDLRAHVAMREAFRRSKGARLALPSELVFLLRTALGLSSVLTRLGARANWYRLMQELIEARIETKATPLPTDPRTVHEHPLSAPSFRAVLAQHPGPFDVILIDPGRNLIQVLRQIRDMTGIGLAQARVLIDGRPKPIRSALPRDEAAVLAERLVEAGADVELRPVSASSGPARA